MRGKDPARPRPLTTPVDGGLTTRWLYGADDERAPDPGGVPGAAPFTRGSGRGVPWAIRQQHAAPARREANAQILEDLEGGVDEILLTASIDGRWGTPVSGADELSQVLAGVYLEMAPVALDAGPDTELLAPLLLELWRQGGQRPDEIRGSLRLDPVRDGARAGIADAGWFEARSAAAVATLGPVRGEFPNVRVLAADMTPYGEAGAGAPLELALALATGIAYLQAGERAGCAPAEIAAALEFTMVVGPDQFLEIAKLRALRRLWAAVLGHCGVAPDRRRSAIYAATSRRMTSSLDPWVNLLRATTAAFAAGVGGADGVTVTPFDEPLIRPGETSRALARRMARNTQLVLLEEAALHRVADPGGGSWYVESLTEQLAERAWSELQAIERAGGVARVVASGTIAQRIAAEQRDRFDDLAHRRRVMTGVNSFPLLGDDGLERGPGDAGLVSPVPQTGEMEDPLVPVRDGAAFEALRARAARLGHPRLAVSHAGSPAEAAHAAGYLAAGGIEVDGQAEIKVAFPPTDDDQVAVLGALLDRLESR